MELDNLTFEELADVIETMSGRLADTIVSECIAEARGGRFLEEQEENIKLRKNLAQKEEAITRLTLDRQELEAQAKTLVEKVDKARQETLREVEAMALERVLEERRACYDIAFRMDCGLGAESTGTAVAFRIAKVIKGRGSW